MIGIFISEAAYISEPGNEINEDIVYTNRKYGWIMDGATGLREANFTSDKTDARWFVKAWSEYLKEAFENSNDSLKYIVKNGIGSVKELYLHEVNRENIDKLDLPSASAGIYRIGEGIFEYLLIGDICLVIEDIEGNIKVIKDTKLEALDNIAVNELRRLIVSNGLSFNEAREGIQEILLKNRRLKNTDKGYWTLEFDSSALDYCIYDKLPLESISKVLFMTDGFFAIHSSYNYFSIKDLISFVDEKGLEEVYRILRDIEEEDKECYRYPRFKKSDDASAIYIKYGDVQTVF